MSDTKALAVIGVGILTVVGIIALVNKPASGGAPPPPPPSPVKPGYWVSPPYPAFPPTWWSSSFNGTSVLMQSVTGQRAWIFPNDVPAYLDGVWTIVP